MQRNWLAVLILIAFISNPLSADVVQESEQYFELRFERTLSVSVDKLDHQILQIQSWWHPDHTYSGDSENLFLDVKKLGCFCERIGTEGLVRHLQVANYRPKSILRLTGGLGPLQSLPVSGVLDFTMTQNKSNTAQLVVTYKVSGSAPDLKSWVKPVNQVLGEQVDRLVKKVKE